MVGARNLDVILKHAGAVPQWLRLCARRGGAPPRTIAATLLHSDLKETIVGLDIYLSSRTWVLRLVPLLLVQTICNSDPRQQFLQDLKNIHFFIRVENIQF